MFFPVVFGHTVYNFFKFPFPNRRITLKCSMMSCISVTKDIRLNYIIRGILVELTRSENSNRVLYSHTWDDHVPSPMARDKFMSKVLPVMDRAFPFSAAVIPEGNVTRSMCDPMKRSRVCTMSADRELCSSTVLSLAIRSVSFSGGRMSLLILTTDRRSPRTLNPGKI